jgi:hypothetical protein
MVERFGHLALLIADFARRGYDMPSLRMTLWAKCGLCMICFGRRCQCDISGVRCQIMPCHPLCQLENGILDVHPLARKGQSASRHPSRENWCRSERASDDLSGTTHGPSSAENI